MTLYTTIIIIIKEILLIIVCYKFGKLKFFPLSSTKDFFAMSRLSYFAVRIVSLFNIVNCLNLYSNNNNPDYDIIYLKNDDLLNSPQHDNGEINYRFVAFGR